MDTTLYSHDHTVRAIDHIDFDILSNETILDMSALGRDNPGIDIPELYDNLEPKKGGLIDARLGTTDANTPCALCGLDTSYCPGHFGHITLAEPVFHMGYIQYVKKILDCICLRCSKLLIHKNEDELEDMLKNKSGKNRMAEIRNITKNVTYCQKANYGCGTQVAKIRIDTKRTTAAINIIAETDLENIKDESLVIEGKKKLRQILTPEIIYDRLKNISDNDCRILGIDPTRSRPEMMIHKIFPVPPVQMRPSARGEFMGGSTMEDDLTHKLADIVKHNFRINKQKENQTEHNSKYNKDYAHLLQYHIATYFDNDAISMPKTEQKGKPFKSLAPRLKGKEGRIRGNLMGKRVDFCGRTVITSDPTIDNNQLGVPVKIAMNLTFPEVVTPNNIEKLTELVRKGRDSYPGANFVFKGSSVMGNKRSLPIDLRYSKGAVELKYGDIVERHLVDGDIVLLNRQPTLHKQSMMGHRIKVINDPELMTYRSTFGL